jgi:hypothetical protein
MTFKELKFGDISETHGEGAVQAYVDLGNGFDVSVVKHKFSYGSEKGLYEMGVFDNQRAAGMNSMCDPLDWGDTVKGWLTTDNVEEELQRLLKL